MNYVTFNQRVAGSNPAAPTIKTLVFPGRALCLEVSILSETIPKYPKTPSKSMPIADNLATMKDSVLKLR